MKKRRRITISALRRRTTIVVLNNVGPGLADPPQCHDPPSDSVEEGTEVERRNANSELIKSIKKENSHETDT
jgi:hypothetical protein